MSNRLLKDADCGCSRPRLFTDGARSRIAVVLMLSLLASCAASTPPLANRQTASSAERIAPALTFRPSSQATFYNEPATGSATDFADDVFAKLDDFARARGVLTHDVRLDLAASDLSRVAALAAMSKPLIDHALGARGIVEPASRVVVARKGSMEQVVGKVVESLGADLFFGNVRVGISSPAGDDPVVVIVVYSAAVSLSPFPRSLGLEAETALDAVLDETFRDPRVTVTRRGGPEHAPSTMTDARAFRTAISCAGYSGRQWIAIEGTGNSGPQVLAVFPVYCGTAPPRTFKLEPMTNVVGVVGTERLESRLRTIINRVRVEAGLSALMSDRRITRAAQRYAAIMRNQPAVDHGLEGAPLDRLRLSGIDPPLVLESVMKVEDLAAASELVMNEPAYRDTSLARAATHVGVGVAQADDGALYIAISYVRIPEPPNVARVRRSITATIDPVARRTVDPQLDAIAQHLAEALAIGWRRASVWPDISAELAPLARRYLKFGCAIETTFDPDQLDPRGMWPNEPGGLGIGIAQSARDGFGTGRVWIVVISGARLRPPQGTRRW